MSGPGDRAPKLPSSGEPTQFSNGEGQDVTPKSVDVAYTSPPESDEFGTFRQPLARKPGDLDAASSAMVSEKQPREGEEPQAAGESVEESDAGMVPKKPVKTWVTPVESVEGKAAAKGKSAARNARSTQREESAPTTLQRIGQRAKEKPKEKWTNLLSHMKAALLKEAHLGLRKDAASGVDEVTWHEYGERLDERLKEEVRKRRHTPVPEQHAWMSSVLTGHYRYYGVPTNYPALKQFREHVAWMWHASLQRRSQRGRWNKQQYQAFKERFPLPPPRIHHPWPNHRFELR